MPEPLSSSRQPVSAEDVPTVSESRIKHAVGTQEKNGDMGAFILNPHKIHFATQGKGEHIALFLRQHPLTQIPWVLSAIILIVTPIIVLPALMPVLPFTIPPNYELVLMLFWYLATGAFIFINYILWYYNVNVVTNKRVIDIDFIYLLVQEVTATRITQIEDVTYRRVGVFAGLFDYGNVFVQTAGAESNIEFLRVPKPKQISQVLIRLMGQTT